MRNKGIKKWGFLVVLFVMFMIFPGRVNAIQELYINGDDSVTPGAEFKYKIELNSDDLTAITNFTTNVYFESSVFTLKGLQTNDLWVCDELSNKDSGTQVSCNSETGVVGNSVVVELVFEVNSNINSNFSYITLRDSKYTYTDELGVLATPQFDELTKDIAIKSNDATLSDIKINDISIEGFASNIYEYDINVDPTLDVANIVATFNNAKASFKEGYGNQEVVLNYGSNVIDLIVISESGIEQLYRLNLTREDTRSTDTTLSGLTIDGVSLPNFRSNLYKYNLIKYQLETLDIVGIPNDEKSTVTVVPPEMIQAGDNSFIVVVTSEKGNTANYTIIVRNIVEPISKKLKNLSVKGFDIDFDKNNNRYEIPYNKEKFKDLHIYYSTVSSSDLVTAVLSPDVNNDFNALSNLKPGDEITVTITGIDGESVLYTIVILEDNRISFFLVLEVLLMIIIILVVAIVLNRRKKNNNKKQVIVKKVEKESDSDVKKKKKFSIFEEDDLSVTKELTEEELKLKK